MRVILFGSTGNLGLNLIPALLVHDHVVVVYVRNRAKLHRLVPESLTSQLTIVEGDATDSQAVYRAILDHECDALIDTAGNQVRPWQEFQLQKICKAVSTAAANVAKERGRPMRAWFIGGLGLLKYPGTEWLLQDYMPKFATEQHQGTLDVLNATNLEEINWSLLCVAFMMPRVPDKVPAVQPLSTPHKHNLAISATSPPNWQDRWYRSIPIVGNTINIMVEVIGGYTTQLMDVADFLAEDLESGSQGWIGKKVGMKNKPKAE